MISKYNFQVRLQSLIDLEDSYSEYCEGVREFQELLRDATDSVNTL